ncbi:NADH-quinone oxidoreductase subunit G [Propioniciclava sinopodophylli]|uniref:NADH-quinone oxidoreductase n=1 Tax=Propioniciclava sinopodophylli TaxID=1837344 RepID=A0A4Q9KCJ9_9ACTN|nr:NADH-quinone oxidoreductase subunit G [Propioniciclava sinopodophylli]TBT83993.1 NADH-quinone oxidoreductase subunit G [Propioniciclava sinopodophylli]
MSVDAKAGAVEKSDLISVFIDGTEVQVPKGTLAIRAAEMIGINIPRFCDHPLLDPVGACRQCMVEVPDMGNGRGMPKPQASCTLEVAPNMQITTQVSSPVADKAQKGMLEFLLINHPLDCPICDKGGECPLQNQAMSHGYAESRYDGVKRTFPKPVSVSAQILLDRERCVLCARCTRFSEQISGDPFIALVERGALQQVGIYADDPYDSYFSGNVVQICPVGALTSADYRFQARPFDLVSTPVTCEICAAGCQLRSDHRHFQVKRRLAGNAPEVNEEWNCDRGRFAFRSGRQADRVTTPLVRDGDVLRPASWPEAIDAAVAGLKAAGSSVGVLTGGRLTLENAYGYAKFARAVLGTNNVDFRAREHSVEEGQFLAHAVAGKHLGDGVTYDDLQNASQVICVSFEPEEESPIVFLRLRKAVRKNKTKVVTVAPYLSNGAAKLGAHLVGTVPGTEAEVVARLEADADTIILVGERAAGALGTLTSAANLAARTGARLAWVPRRAGDRGAVEAGCLPNLLPGGRPVSDATARVDMQAAWGVAKLPAQPGLDTGAMLHAATTGDLAALVVAGVQPTDLPDAVLAREAFEKVGFLLSLETRISEVTERADVVLPVDLIEDQAGTFLNWEHREGRVNRVNRQTPSPMTDLRVLAMLADALGSDLGIRTAKSAKAELDGVGVWEGGRSGAPSEDIPMAPRGEGLLLASWRQLIDGSAGNDGAPALLATAKPVVARVSPATASGLGLTEGDTVTVASAGGSAELTLFVEDSMVDGVVWVPGNRGGEGLGELRVTAGEYVTVTGGAA